MKAKGIVIGWCLLALIAWIYSAYGKQAPAYRVPVQQAVKRTPSVPPNIPPKVKPVPVPMPEQLQQSRIDLVFCLDTTGSMGGLIEGAKQKIWSIVNNVATAQPKPVLRIGLVGYRDISDSYVTQLYDFSSDLDLVYSRLKAFGAGGGGDTPEHVNRALHEAVNNLQWSKDQSALKILYLVGDAPPHLDYQDGYNYTKIAKRAAASGIIINTIQCGEMADTRMVWQEIARLGEGRYAAISQDGGMIAINSPYDGELNRLSSELNSTYLAYGAMAAEKAEAQTMYDMDASARGGAAAADRAASKASSLYKNESWDLVDAVKSNPAAPASIAPEEMPKELQGKTETEQREYIQQQADKRAEIQAKIQELSKKRDAHVEDEKKKLKNGGRDSFDEQVLDTLKDQGKKKGIVFNK